MDVTKDVVIMADGERVSFSDKYVRLTGVPSQVIVDAYHDRYLHLPGAMAVDKMKGDMRELQRFRRELDPMYTNAPDSELWNQIQNLRKRGCMSVRGGKIRRRVRRMPHVSEKEAIEIQEHIEAAQCKNESANDRQVGGNHYKKHGAIQPWDVVAILNLDFFQGTIFKHIVRWRDKLGVEDLEKARHYLDKYIEVEKQKLASGRQSSVGG